MLKIWILMNWLIFQVHEVYFNLFHFWLILLKRLHSVLYLKSNNYLRFKLRFFRFLSLFNLLIISVNPLFLIFLLHNFQVPTLEVTSLSSDHTWWKVLGEGATIVYRPQMQTSINSSISHTKLTMINLTAVSTRQLLEAW